MSFKKKLIVNIILSLILCGSINYVCFLNYKQVADEKNNINTVNHIRVLVNESILTIKNNSNLLDKPYELSKILSPSLKKIKADVKILDLKGRVLFQSNENLDKDFDINYSLNCDSSFTAENSDLAKSAFPLILNDEQKGNIIFYIDKSMIQQKNINVFKYLKPILIMSNLLILIISIFFIDILINVLKPLDRLKTSMIHCLRFKMDKPIKYYKNNEIGQVLKTYNLLQEEIIVALNKDLDNEVNYKKFIANISHEIKTPVAYIKAYIEALEDGICLDDKDVTNKYISIISKKVDSLSKLIEGFFNQSQKDLKKLKINKSEVLSKEFLLKVLNSIKLQFYNSSIKFIMPDKIPNILINMDAIRIEQVIVNIIENAKKHISADGLIEVDVYLDEGYLYISITDNGEGIVEGDMPYIFDIFYQGENSKLNDYSGAGLGLSLCKYIVESHNGQIFVESMPKEGSTFTFTLPKA